MRIFSKNGQAYFIIVDKDESFFPILEKMFIRPKMAVFDSAIKETMRSIEPKKRSRSLRHSAADDSMAGGMAADTPICYMHFSDIKITIFGVIDLFKTAKNIHELVDYLHLAIQLAIWDRQFNSSIDHYGLERMEHEIGLVVELKELLDQWFYFGKVAPDLVRMASLNKYGDPSASGASRALILDANIPIPGRIEAVIGLLHGHNYITTPSLDLPSDQKYITLDTLCNMVSDISEIVQARSAQNRERFNSAILSAILGASNSDATSEDGEEDEQALPPIVALENYKKERQRRSRNEYTVPLGRFFRAVGCELYTKTEKFHAVDAVMSAMRRDEKKPIQVDAQHFGPLHQGQLGQLVHSLEIRLVKKNPVLRN